MNAFYFMSLFFVILMLVNKHIELKFYAFFVLLEINRVIFVVWKLTKIIKILNQRYELFISEVVDVLCKLNQFKFSLNRQYVKKTRFVDNYCFSLSG